MPALIIHGGAGRARNKDGCDAIAASLDRIATECWNKIEQGETAMRVAIYAAVQLENDPLFNAGFGSKLQQDGTARLSAALMDGSKARFSGVVNAQGILNPILLCEHLQTERRWSKTGGRHGVRRAKIPILGSSPDTRIPRNSHHQIFHTRPPFGLMQKVVSSGATPVTARTCGRWGPEGVPAQLKMILTRWQPFRSCC